jgi:septal ring factor EnvC (AmiA/AmiB activator)
MITSELRSLQENIQTLEASKQSKAVEVSKLMQEENKYQKSIISLKQKEGQLRAEIEERKKSMALLDKAIADLIEEEAKKMTDSKVRDGRYLKLSAGFEGNKGKLPWPTSKGLITSNFGEHNHPVLKGVKIKNNGVDITTDEKANVKSIYDGEVKKIVTIPGSNIAVLIRHGDYLTVYSNITMVKVKVGDMVKSLQQIGQAYTDPSTGKGIYNLQIWHESNIQNPAEWILP